MWAPCGMSKAQEVLGCIRDMAGRAILGSLGLAQHGVILGLHASHGWGTVECCYTMDGACPKLPGGRCKRGRGQGQELGAGVQRAKSPLCTRVLFTCAPAAAAARTPDGCPKALGCPPALGAPSRLDGILAVLRSQDTGLGAAGVPRAWLGAHPVPTFPWDTAPHHVPTLRWQGGEQGGCGVPGEPGGHAQPSSSQMVPHGAMTLQGLPYRTHDGASGVTSE